MTRLNGLVTNCQQIFSESLDDEDNYSVGSTQTIDKKLTESQNTDKKVTDSPNIAEKVIESQISDSKLTESQNGDKKPVDVDIKVVEKKLSVKKVDSAATSLTSFKGSGRNYFYVSHHRFKPWLFLPKHGGSDGSGFASRSKGRGFESRWIL